MVYRLMEFILKILIMKKQEKYFIEHLGMLKDDAILIYFIHS